MTLRPLRQQMLAGVAQDVDHIAPVGRLVVQLDAMAHDRPINLGLDAGPIVLGAAAGLGAEPIGLVDDERDQLGHALERARLIRRQCCQRQKILQERLFERQRIFASHLQIEDVEFHPGHELQRDEDRLVLALRAERLLDEPHEAFGRFADIGLADERQFGAVGAHDSRTEAQADIDGVGEDGFARTRGCHEDIDHQGPLAAAGGIIGPDAAVRPAEQHASGLPGRRRAIPWQHRKRVAEQRQGRVRRRRERQTGGAAHHALQRIADDRGRFGVAPTLDALRQCGYPAAQLRCLLDRRPGREACAQPHADMVLLRTRLLEKGERAAQIGIAGEHREKAGPDVLELHRRLPAALDDDRASPGDAIEAERGRQFHERPRVLGTDVHIDCRVGIIPKVHALAAMRHRIRIEELVADRRPEQVLRLRPGNIVLRAARHHDITRQARPPIGARHFPIHGLPAPRRARHAGQAPKRRHRARAGRKERAR